MSSLFTRDEGYLFFRHPHTGLLVAADDPCMDSKDRQYPLDAFEYLPDVTELRLDPRAYLLTLRFSIETRFFTERAEDIPKLLEMLKAAGEDEVRIVVEPEFFKEQLKPHYTVKSL